MCLGVYFTKLPFPSVLPKTANLVSGVYSFFALMLLVIWICS